MSPLGPELPDEETPLLSGVRSNGTPQNEEPMSSLTEKKSTLQRFLGSRFSCATFLKSSSPARFRNPRVFFFVLLMLVPYSLMLAAVTTTEWHRVPDSSPPIHSGLLVSCNGTLCLPFQDPIVGYEVGAFLMISSLVSVFLIPIKSFALPAWSWESFLTVWILLWFISSMTGSLLAVLSTPYGTSGSTGNSSFLAITASGMSLLIWLAKMYVSCDSD